METIIAIDVGGTHQRFAIIDLKGNVLEKMTYPSHRDMSSSAFFQSLQDRISDHLKKNLCKGVALALPIVLDDPTGKVQDAPNLPFLVGQNLKQSLSLPRVLDWLKKYNMTIKER